MSVPGLDGFDHAHVYVQDRAAAEAWYRDVLGFVRMKEYESWADGGGPLTIRDASGRVHLALFERPREKCRSVLALRVGAGAFLAWRDHLGRALGRVPEVVDHGMSWSLYLSDPDGNPYEITTYEYGAVKESLP